MRPSPKHLTLFYLAAAICSISALALFLLSLYILPNVFFGAQYAIPDIVIQVGEWFRIHHEFTGAVLAIATFAPFILLALILGLLSRSISRRVEVKTIDVTEAQSEELQLHGNWRQYTFIILLSAIGLILLVFLLNAVILIDELSHLGG